MARKIEIQVVGSTGDFDRAMNKTESRLNKVGKAARVGLAIGVGAGVVALKKSVGAALEAEQAEFRLNQAFDSTKVSLKQRKRAQEAVNKVSNKAALDDEDLSDVLARLTRSTGSVKDATEGMALSAEIARGRNVSLEQASKAVEKAYLGNEKALRRLGVVVPDVDKAYAATKQRIFALQDQLKTAEGPQKKAIEAAIENEKAQLKNAKALDKAATSQNAIKKAQEQFAGSSEKYGQTAAGAQDRFRVAVENLEESLGKLLLPVVERVASAASRFATYLQENEGAAKALGIAFGVLAGAIVLASIAQLALNLAFLASPIGLVIVACAALAVGLAVLYKKSETFRNAVNLLKDHWRLLLFAFGVLPGVAIQIVKHWDDIKDAMGRVKDAFVWLKNNVVSIVSGAWSGITGALEAMKDSFGLLSDAVEGVKKGINWLHETGVGAFNGFKAAIETPLGKLRTSFYALKTTLEGIKEFFSWILDKAKDIAGAFGKIFGGGQGLVDKLGAGDIDGNTARAMARQGQGGPNPRLVAFGRAAQRMGYHVGEHPAFGGVNPVHAHYGAADHYHGGALDINADNFPGGEGAALDRLKGIIGQWFGRGSLSPWGPGVLWRTQGHYDHLHISAHDKGGIVPGPIGMPRLALVHGGETVLPTHKQRMGGPMTLNLQLDGKTLARLLIDPLRGEVKQLAARGGTF